MTPRREVKVKALTGNYRASALITDDDTVIQGSKKIIAWPQAHRLPCRRRRRRPSPNAPPAAR